MNQKDPAAHTPNSLGNWHDLQKHLEGVAAKAEAYAAKIGAAQLGYYTGLWHDLGKYNPKFQAYLEQCHNASQLGNNDPLTSVPHAIHGARLAWEVLQPLAPIIYGHHAGLPEKEYMKQRLLEPELEKSYQEVMRQARQYLSQLQPTTDPRRMLENPPRHPLEFELLTRILFSCLVDADYLDTEAHFDENTAHQRGSSIQPKKLWSIFQQEQDKLLKKAEDTPVNRVRREVYQACIEAAEMAPGIFRLSVPTGGGKTLSGLAFALRHAVLHSLDRVIIAVPYTSIIEQTVGVYRRIFGEEAVLEHHSAARTDFGNQEDARRLQAQARLATQNWDAPLIVTTTVQLFESLFANRPSRCRKLHNIVGSVIVLDEVQTLPIGLLDPILSVLRELVQRYRVTVVLCTATQPALEGQSLYLEGFEAGSVQNIVPSQQARVHFSTLSRVAYEAPPEAWSWEQLVQDIRHHNYAQALVILNTRKDALNVLDALGSKAVTSQSFATPEMAVWETLTRGQIFHLSTLMCGAHRRQVLEEVKRRLNPKHPQPCLLVSTQVVEAGVDLDFPVVYRALGPLDRIVQAAGRCNREGKMPGKGRVVIFEPKGGKIPPGEYATAVAETARLLRRETLDLDNPAIFETYYRSLYQSVKDKDKFGIQALREALNFPEVATRFKIIGDDTTPVVIQYDEKALRLVEQIRKKGLFSAVHRALQPYLVALRKREFEASEGLREEIAPGLWVWQGNYDSVQGIGMGNSSVAYEPVDPI